MDKIMQIPEPSQEQLLKLFDYYNGFINSHYCVLNVQSSDHTYLLTRLDSIRNQFMVDQQRNYKRLAYFDKLLSLVLFEPYIPYDVPKSDYTTMILYFRNKVDEEPNGPWMHPFSEHEARIKESLSVWRKNTNDLTNWFNHEPASQLIYREFKYVSA